MRIISKFHDYYDTAVGFGGFDKHCIYKRLTEKVISDKNIHPTDSFYYPLVIGLAGEFYPCIHYKNNGNQISKFIYSKDELLIWKKERGVTKRKNKQLLEWFDRDFSKLKPYFEQYNSPILLFHYYIGLGWWWSHDEYNLTVNPCLKDIEFMRIKDPYTTFQEVYMYVSGVLGNKEEETTVIDDKTKAQQKGFDKWSFRKKPTKNPK